MAKKTKRILEICTRKFDLLYFLYVPFLRYLAKKAKKTSRDKRTHLVRLKGSVKKEVPGPKHCMVLGADKKSKYALRT